jgi:hypothetical protein
VLNERPLFTKMLTGVMGTFLGDLLAQFLGSITGQGKKTQLKGQLSPVQRPLIEFDAVRSARLVLYSALVGTPLAHLWFSYLDAVSNKCCWHREWMGLTGLQACNTVAFAAVWFISLRQLKEMCSSLPL